MKLTVKVAPTTISAQWECAFCNQMFEGEAALADLFDDMQEHQGVVCPGCLAAGAQQLKARYPALAQSQLTMPSFANYQAEVRFGEFLQEFGTQYSSQLEAWHAFQLLTGELPKQPSLELPRPSTMASFSLAS